jgi:hypothetical protein
MNLSNSKVCLDKQNLGDCTRGEDCQVCNDLSSAIENSELQQLNFNKNAKGYIPKSKRTQNNKENVAKDTENNKLNFNLAAREYIPKAANQSNPQLEDGTNNQMNMEMYQHYYYEENAEKAEEMEEEDEGEEFDMIMKDIINNEALEEMEEEDESDEDKWFPKFKECECCKGFVYKCKGIACANMNSCYCKVKEECDDEDA